VSRPVETVVVSVASDVLGVPAERITLDSSPETIETWDSLQHLNITLALEDELGIQFEPDDIERMQSIGAIVELAEQYTASR
jgi:acyl carrier protein